MRALDAYILPHVAFLISYSDAGDNKQYKGEKGEERNGKVVYKGEEGRECGKQRCIRRELSLLLLVLVVFWSCRCC